MQSQKTLYLEKLLNKLTLNFQCFVKVIVSFKSYHDNSLCQISETKEQT